jgi:hypothetical protein
MKFCNRKLALKIQHQNLVWIVRASRQKW